MVVRLVVGAPLAASYGLPAVVSAGVTAQTVLLTGGVVGVAPGQWGISAVAGAGIGGVMVYDAGLRVRPQGGSTASSSFQEVLPNAPSPALMNFITTNTNGAYQFNTAGMTYGPNPAPDRVQCASAECAAGLAGSQGRGLLPDYVSANPGFHTFTGNASTNLYDGTTYVGGGVNVTNMNPGFGLATGMTAGYIFGVNDARGTNEFLGGSGAQASISVSVFGRFNFTMGVNHSYGGATAIEFGLAPPGAFGVGYSPFGYSTPVTGDKK